MNVERNIILLESHIRKLDPLEDICSLEARKACRPEEGVRYCDLLAEDLTSLSGLPDTGDADIAASVSSSLGTYKATVANCRCLFLSLCYMSAETGESKSKAEISKQLEDFAELDAFPPGFRDI